MITQGLNTSGGDLTQGLNAPLLSAEATVPVAIYPTVHTPAAGATTFGFSPVGGGGGYYRLPMASSYSRGLDWKYPDEEITLPRSTPVIEAASQKPVRRQVPPPPAPIRFQRVQMLSGPPAPPSAWWAVAIFAAGVVVGLGVCSYVDRRRRSGI